MACIRRESTPSADPGRGDRVRGSSRSQLPGSLMVTWQMSCCRSLGPVHYLAMYQVARAGLRICMNA
jgi:hypothetical protein